MGVDPDENSKDHPATRAPAERQPPIRQQESRTSPGPHRMTSNSLLLCFSGKIGSGKTSTSIAVANALSCGYASFGGYLRDLVVDRGGDPDCRQTLQDLGQHLIQQDAESFCRNVLARADFVPGCDFVLDGVRHFQVLEHLDRIAAPSDVRLIFLEADTELRASRVGERSNWESKDFARAGGHVVEADMERALPEAAHARIEASLSEPDLLRQCLEQIEAWRQAGTGAARAVPPAAPGSS